MIFLVYWLSGYRRIPKFRTIYQNLSPRRLRLKPATLWNTHSLCIVLTATCTSHTHGLNYLHYDHTIASRCCLLTLTKSIMSPIWAGACGFMKVIILTLYKWYSRQWMEYGHGTKTPMNRMGGGNEYSTIQENWRMPFNHHSRRTKKAPLYHARATSVGNISGQSGQTHPERAAAQLLEEKHCP